MSHPLSVIGGNSLLFCDHGSMAAERKIEVSAEQRLKMNVVNDSDGRCIVAVRLIVGVRYLERPLRDVLLYILAPQLCSTHAINTHYILAQLCSTHAIHTIYWHSSVVHMQYTLYTSTAL